jgi:integrase
VRANWIFWEDIHNGWVRVIGHPDHAYQVKGRRDKQFPALECLAAIWPQPVHVGRGLLFHRRTATANSIASSTKSALVAELQRKRLPGSQFSASQERRLRDAVLSDADQLGYDQVKTEFGKISKGLAWPKTATLKDFRHLFATCLENAGVPESYRRFFMGHSPGRAAIVTYTHLNKLRDHYFRALDTELKPLVEAIERRS